MREKSATLESIPQPPNIEFVTSWDSLDDQQCRMVYGPDRYVTDSSIRVYGCAYQLEDGSFAQGGGPLDPPTIYIANGESSTGLQVNSDQAREMASYLLQAAGEIDQWVAK